MTEETKFENFKSPGLVTICHVIGALTLLIGGLMTVFALIAAFGPPPHPADTGSFLACAFAVLFSSIFWFGFGRIIDLLAEIAHNTTRKS